MVVIIGVLAAIAIPVFLHQRGSAADAATKRDLVAVAEAVIARMLDVDTVTTVTVVSDHYEVDGEEVGSTSHEVRIAGVDPAAADTTGWTPSAWCLGFTNPAGSLGDFRFSAQQGLEPGTCSSPTVP